MDRRSILKLFVGSGAAPMVARAIPDTTSQVTVGKPSDDLYIARLDPLYDDPSVQSGLQNQITRMAIRAAFEIEKAVPQHARIEGCGGFPLRVHKSKSLNQVGDIINFAVWPRGLPKPERNIRVPLLDHYEASFSIQDFARVADNPDYLLAHLRPACYALAEAVVEKSKGAEILAYGLLPRPLLGLGVIAARAQSLRTSIRLILAWNPESLAQMFTVDMLIGAA